jgi:NAD(P)-dependent dehydrogenase (short-subunit alcohol dehydrogenase family)
MDWPDPDPQWLEPPAPQQAAPNAPSDFLAHRVIAVTGAGRGFGHVVARHLAQAGATLILIDSDASAAAMVASEIEQARRNAPASRSVAAGAGAQAIPIKADLGSQLEVASTFEKISALYGALDGLVHLAAVESKTSFRRLYPGEWNEVFDSQMRAAYLVMHHLVRFCPNAWSLMVLPPEREQDEAQTLALRGALAGLLKGLAKGGMRTAGLVPSRAAGGLESDARLAQVATALAWLGGVPGALVPVQLPPLPSLRDRLGAAFFDPAFDPAYDPAFDPAFDPALDLAPAVASALLADPLDPLAED